jgi:hypothetical protein
MEVTPREVSKTCCDGGSCKVGRYVYVDHKKKLELNATAKQTKIKAILQAALSVGNESASIRKINRWY